MLNYLIDDFDVSEVVPDLESASVALASAAAAVDLRDDPAAAARQVVGPALLPLVLRNLHSGAGVPENKSL